MAIEPIKDTRKLVFVTSPHAIQPDFSPDFYSTSTFRITEPEHGLAFIRDLRPDNLAHVRKLSVFVEAFYARASPSSPSSGSEKTPPLPFWISKPNAPTWYALLEAFRDRLPGLRELEIYLHAELTGYHQDIPRMGAGEDPEFVARLAALKGLEKLELDGFFAREWPAYLERELGLGSGGETGKGESVWTAKSRMEAYLKLLGRYQGYCAPREL